MPKANYPIPKGMVQNNEKILLKIVENSNIRKFIYKYLIL